MHTLSIAKYQARFKLEPVGWFYLFFIGFIVGLNIYAKAINMNIHENGFEFSSFVLVFVIGLNSFKNAFQVSLANGTSRKAMFGGTLLSMGAITLLMTVVDGFLSPLIAKFGNTITLFQAYYYQRYYDIDFSLQMTVENAIWRLATMIFIYLIGYFITVLYYRMNTHLKIIVSVGVPMLFLFIIPMVLTLIPFFDATKFITDMVTTLFGVKTANPWMAILTTTVGSFIMIVVDYLMIRRVVVKGK